MKILSQHFPDSSALSKTVYYALFDDIANRLIGVIQFEESISEIDLTELVTEILRDHIEDKRFYVEEINGLDVVLNMDSEFFQFSTPGYISDTTDDFYRLERTKLWKNK